MHVTVRMRQQEKKNHNEKKKKKKITLCTIIIERAKNWVDCTNLGFHRRKFLCCLYNLSRHLLVSHSTTKFPHQAQTNEAANLKRTHLFYFIFLSEFYFIYRPLNLLIKQHFIASLTCKCTLEQRYLPLHQLLNEIIMTDGGGYLA